MIFLIDHDDYFLHICENNDARLLYFFSCGKCFCLCSRSFTIDFSYL